MTSLNESTIILTSTGLTTASTAYTDGDGLGAVMTATIPSSKTDCIVISATVMDKADVIGAIDLFFHTSTVTFATDNAAPSISDADNLKGLPTLSIPTALDLGGCRRGSVDSLGVGVHADASSQFFVSAVTRSGHTFFGAAGDLQYVLTILTDV